MAYGFEYLPIGNNRRANLLRNIHTKFHNNLFYFLIYLLYNKSFWCFAIQFAFC